MSLSNLKQSLSKMYIECIKNQPSLIIIDNIDALQNQEQNQVPRTY